MPHLLPRDGRAPVNLTVMVGAALSGSAAQVLGKIIVVQGIGTLQNGQIRPTRDAIDLTSACGVKHLD
jgi:hypothetical protein